MHVVKIQNCFAFFLPSYCTANYFFVVFHKKIYSYSNSITKANVVIYKANLWKKLHGNWSVCWKKNSIRSLKFILEAMIKHGKINNVNIHIFFLLQFVILVKSFSVLIHLFILFVQNFIIFIIPFMKYVFIYTLMTIIDII